VHFCFCCHSTKKNVIVWFTLKFWVLGAFHETEIVLFLTIAAMYHPYVTQCAVQCSITPSKPLYIM
jgi:hypothetical protein